MNLDELCAKLLAIGGSLSIETSFDPREASDRGNLKANIRLNCRYSTASEDRVVHALGSIGERDEPSSVMLNMLASSAAMVLSRRGVLGFGAYLPHQAEKDLAEFLDEL